MFPYAWNSVEYCLVIYQLTNYLLVERGTMPLVATVRVRLVPNLERYRSEGAKNAATILQPFSTRLDRLLFPDLTTQERNSFQQSIVTEVPLVYAFRFIAHLR